MTIKGFLIGSSEIFGYWCLGVILAVFLGALGLFLMDLAKSSGVLN